MGLSNPLPHYQPWVCNVECRRVWVNPEMCIVYLCVGIVYLVKKGCVCVRVVCVSYKCECIYVYGSECCINFKFYYILISILN